MASKQTFREQSRSSSSGKTQDFVHTAGNILVT